MVRDGPAQTESSPTGSYLEGSEGYNETFNIVRTNEEEKTIEELRRDLEIWVKNELFDEIRGEDIDLAIVFEPADPDNDVDVDNFVKPVISALQNHEKDDRDRHLIEDDSQIKRLLVHKLETQDRSEPYDEPRLSISFREYNPKRQMIMESLVAI